MPGLPTAPTVQKRETWFDVHDLWSIGTNIRGPSGAEVRLSYHRLPVLGQGYIRGYAPKVVELLGLSPSHRIAVVGGAFGWFPEYLRTNFGWSDERLLVVDPCPYFIGSQAGTEEADINTALQSVGIDINTDAGKRSKAEMFDGGTRCRVRFSGSRLENQSAANSVRSLFSSSAVDFVITDDGFLDYHDDEQIADVLDACDRLGARIVHLVYENWTASSRPLAQWKALRPQHTFVSMWTWQVA